MTSSPDLALASEFAPADRAQWLALVDKVLKGASFDRSLVSTTYDGIAIQPLYTQADVDAVREFPGQRSFTRGASAAGPADGAWGIRQTHDHPDAATANARLLEDLEGGVSSFAVRLDLAEGNDHGGVVIGSIDDLDTLMDGVLLDLAAVILDAGRAFGSAADLLVELWDRRKISGDERRGNLGADPLGTLAATGALPAGIDAALGEVLRLATATRSWPHVRAVHVDTGPYVDAGASEAEELAVMIATGTAYLRLLVDSGLSTRDAADQIEFTIAADADVFATIAKLRAARRLWAHVVAAAGGSSDGSPAAAAPRISARTATRMMTRRDPWVNMLRTTAACFAAGAGGADSVTVQPFDAALGLADDLGRRIARNTQLMLQEESHIAAVLDPAGGSYFIETLTDQFSDLAWKRFQAIEASGGMLAVLVDGSEAAILAATSEARLRNIARRKDPLTGVTEFPNIEERILEREQPDVEALRSKLWSSAPSSPSASATVITPLPAVRLAQEFEALRDASDLQLEATGVRPRVFLANLGPIAVHTARATFAKNLFESGGIESVGDRGYDDDASLAEAFAASGAPIAVICSSDKVYADRAAPTAIALKGAGARRVFLAGNPGEHREAFTDAGVDEFVHVGIDVLAALESALNATEVTA